MRALVLLLHLGVLGSWRLFAQCPDGSPPPCRAQPARAVPTPAPNSVAVLYLDARDSADAYLAEGLTEAVIVRLGQIERLVVKSRNAVRRFRGRAAADAGLGRALGVAHLVSGTVRRAGLRMRVTVALVRAVDGVQLWTEQYDRPDVDLLLIEEEIAREVARGIAGRLLPAEQASLAARPTGNARAYDHLLRGNYYLAQRSARAAARAIAEYDAAARLDSAFVTPLARIAYAHFIILNYGWDYAGVRPESLLARGFEAADRALQRDSLASDAWLARAALLSVGSPRSLTGVREAFEHAIALDPRNAEAYHQYGTVLRLLRDDSAAVLAYQRALALDPVRPITLAGLAYAAIHARRFEEARRWADSALAADPGFALAYVARARILLQLGAAVAEARSDAETALRLGDQVGGGAVLALAELRAGDSLAARARVDALVRGIAHPTRPTVREGEYIGAALIAVERVEEALALLERVAPVGVLLWDSLRLPEFDPIRSHPRFQRLVEESRPR